MGDIEEYPFLFMNTPLSLQLLASTEVALMLWQYRCAASGHSCEDFGWLLWEKSVFRCEEILVVPVPSRIKSQIDAKIITVGEELLKWKNFHFDIFKNEEKFSKFFKHIVLDFSGTIGYKATAMNILNSGEFADLENYKMACLYCLEDQVRRFWPLVTTDVNFEYDTCNCSYWNGVMKSGENSIIDRPSEPFRERWMEFANWGDDGTAFEHFHQMLPDYETVQVSMFFLTSGNCLDAIRSLPTLNRVQVEEIFKGKASTMFGILARNDEEDFLQYAHQSSWTLMRHLILENESRFFSVLHVLWKIAFCFDDDGDIMSYTRSDKINKLLLEIWSDASDELKAAVSDNHINEFFDEEFNEFGSYFHYYGHDMKFMIDLLNISRGVDKAWLWRDNWRGFALRAKVSDFEILMSSCLMIFEDDVEFYKNALLDFKDFFHTLMRYGLYSDLKDYLYFCSKDVKHFQQLGKNQLESSLHIILRHDDDQFAKFEWFVGELFSNEKKDVDEFKVQMISSAESLKCLLKARNHHQIRLKCLLEARRNYRQIRSNDFSTLIGRFATEEDKYNLVKRKLLEHCRSYPTNCTGRIHYFDEWIEFLEWCIGDQEIRSAFKQSINVEAIFLKFLSYYAIERSISDMKYLDEFLRWYFENEEDRKNFKIGIIKKKYARIYFEYAEMRSNNDDDRRYALSCLLRWFFDNNTEQLYKFCESYNFILHPRVSI